MDVWEIVGFYYVVITVLVGFCGSLAISTFEEIYKMELVLKNKRELVRCVFMYQFAAYELLKDKINRAGIIIVEVFTTLSVWFLNIFVFAWVACLWLIKMICYLFWLIFRKKEDENADD